MELAIGGAQFGLDYGISNKAGKINLIEAKNILKVGRDSGLDTVDTAAAYGDSEAMLGIAGLKHWKVISKTPPGIGGKGDAIRCAKDSIEKLKITKLAYYLVHSEADLLGGNGKDISAGMMAIKAAGLADKVGFSIYSPDNLERLLDIFPADIIQAPLNVFDQRLVTSGWLQRLTRYGVEVHARSVFLQGLLLLSPESRPEKFRRWSKLWNRWDSYVDDSLEKALSLCIGFVKCHPTVEKIVIGVEDSGSLKQVIDAFTKAKTFDAEGLSSCDTILLEPHNWRLM